MKLKTVRNFFSHLFVPGDTNNYKSRLLHSPIIIFIALFYLSFQLIILGFTHTKTGVLGYAAQISPQEVINLTNQKRLDNGLLPVVENASLTAAAQAKAAHMLSNNYWAHVAPDGTEPWYFFANAGYEYKFAGENLARDFSNPQAAVDAWMASPSHRDNMLSEKYKEIGIAVIEGDLSGSDTTIIVQLFGTRATDTLPVVPVAAAESSTPAPVFTPEPTPAPTSVPTPEPAQPLAQVSQSTSSQNQVSPFEISRAISLGLIAILSFALLIDAVIIMRRKVTRIASKNAAHIGFIVMVLLIILIANSGSIL